MFYELSNGILSIKVNSFGGEIVSLKRDGIERLWQNDNGSWEGHAPLLFPVCGHVKVRFHNKLYKTPPHGFALTSEFSLADKTNNSITLSIKSNPSTKEIYPFDFIYNVTFALNADVLNITHEVINPTNEDIFFACGGHETFALKGKLKDYSVEFNKTESPVWYQEHGITVKADSMPYALEDGRVLRFPNRYISGVRTLIFGGIKSDKLILKNKKGEPCAEVGFKGFSNMLFWRPKKADMICIEPWINLPDRAEDKKVDISEKRFFIKVKPNSSEVLNRYVKYYSAR